MDLSLEIIAPEIALFVGCCVVMITGLSPSQRVRDLTAVLAGLALVAAGGLAANTPLEAAVEAGLPFPAMVGYVKVLVAGVGLILLLLMAGTIGTAREGADGSFNPLRAERGEFYAFYLFSLTGVMLCASASDLIWLFLALELTSLPTYVMVVMSGRSAESRSRAQEAGVKYFFLGALSAATFLYGFALLYGASGSTRLPEIAAAFETHGVGSLATLGMTLTLIGVSFKIAAVPMHFYTADVYEGSSSTMAAFLAFVPKTAGMVSIIVLVSTMGWRGATSGFFGSETGQLPVAVDVVLWGMAALTMTVGNVLAWLQSSVKRMLAYSSIAHSGYMLVGVIAGPGDGAMVHNGIAAALFYLLCYGVMNVGAFAVLACLEREQGVGRRAEIESVDDLRGLRRTHPGLAIVMGICALSLLGLPPLLGFWGKFPLFTSAISAGRIPLVVVLGLNSAIAAFYYLRLVAAVWLEDPEKGVEAATTTPFPTRRVAAGISAAGVVLLAMPGVRAINASERAGAPGAWLAPFDLTPRANPDEAGAVEAHHADTDQDDARVTASR